ncbi:MAG: 5-(carboxyamino)imidazole ribonucleotide synthase [Deltaproteobacteria bacterium]|nr:5-(carboxyamino)imidazole ribonucleotide synthase [Deltaproteobacteria bacterium]
MSTILPGATLGILGGGQLGRMTAMAARTLGYHIHALDPDPSCAARFVVERCVVGEFDDAERAADLAAQCDVVTLEIEKVSIASLEAASKHAPVRPGPHVLHVVQDRERQKSWLGRNGFPVGPWQAAGEAAEIAAAVARFGRVFVKATGGGYDGRGQVELDASATSADATDALRSLGGGRCVVERALDLAGELSVLVARRPSGGAIVFPPAVNHHVDRILAWSVLPGAVAPDVASRASEIARAIADSLDVVGLLVVELFLLKDGTLLVNELAPRPHNSFHATELACATSQFEQMVRAVFDLPLGSVEVLRPAAIVNLLGDLWLGDAPPPFDRALELPGVRLHLYGKRVARPGRKMGHLSAIGATSEEALARVREAASRLASRG